MTQRGTVTPTLTPAQILARLNALGTSGALFDANVFALKDPSAPTKIAKFSAASITAGQTRTYTLPDATGTVPLIGLAQTWSATQTFGAIDATSIGATTRGTGLFTTLGANGVASLTNATAATSTSTGALVVTGGAGVGGALYVGGALNVAGAATMAAVAATTVSASGQITSTVATGTAPFVVASTTAVANLNASLLLGSSWAIPGSIGATTPAAGAFTTLSSSGLSTLNSASITTTLGVTGAVTIGGTLGVTGVLTTTVGASFGSDIGITGKVLPNNSVSAYLNGSQGAVYGSTGSASFPFNQSGNLVLEARGGANPRAVVLASAGGSFTAYLDAVGTFNVPSTTASTSTSTGALIVTGGVGIGGAVYIGGLLNVAGQITLSNGAAPPTFTIDDTSGLGGQGRSFVFANSGAASKFNWKIGCQITINDAFEIIPSDSAGSSSYSTPVFALKTGNVILGAQAALATNATNGFAYVPTCAGTPTGVPTSFTGKVAIVVDTTNHKLYFYDGSWRDAGP